VVLPYDAPYSAVYINISYLNLLVTHTNKLKKKEQSINFGDIINMVCVLLDLNTDEWDGDTRGPNNDFNDHSIY